MNCSVSVRLWPVQLSNMEVWFKCDDNHVVGRNTEVHQSLFVVAPNSPEYNYFEGEYYDVRVLDLDTFKQIVAYAEMCGMISHETGDKFIQRAITQKATLDDID